MRAAAGMFGALAALFAAGVLLFGLGGGSPVAEAAGCRERPLTFDAAERTRQAAFERRLSSGATLPAPGFHRGPVDATASLHAVSHGVVVVYYRPGAADAALHALAAAATAVKAPVLVAPREQADAVVALASDRELTCGDGTGVRAFAARWYPDLKPAA